jgi:hypothetical protein
MSCLLDAKAKRGSKSCPKLLLSLINVSTSASYMESFRVILLLSPPHSPAACFVLEAESFAKVKAHNKYLIYD